MKHLLTLCLIAFCTLACDKSTTPDPEPNNTPAVNLSDFTTTEGNTENKSIFISILLTTPASEVVTVSIAAEDGSAKAGEDYNLITQTVDFNPGKTQENIRIEIVGDEEQEVDESFTLKITSASGASLGKSSSTITIENDDFLNGDVNFPTSGYSTPTSYEGMKLTFNDEFDQESLDNSIWTHEIGNGNWGWGNNELQFYRKENTSIQDGYLVIQALDQNYSGFNYTSSRMITKDKFDFTHGRVDIRALLPEGQGLWPALWMLGSNISSVGWPRCGEIDIMEILGHEPSIVHGTVHYSNSAGDHIFTGQEKRLSGNKKFSEEFNVFSIVWTEGKIEWYLNDVKYNTVTRQSLGSQNPYPFDNPFFFIFNVAVGGNWPGSPDASTVFPQIMAVDYIRVFQPE